MGVIFGLEQDFEEWIVYPESPDEEYCIRPLTDELIRDWNKQCTRKVWRQNYQERVDERDDERYNALLCEQIIGGWRGAIYLTVEDARAGRTSECNLKNKLKFAGTQAERFNWIATVARELGSRVAREIEAQREGFREPNPSPVGLSSASMQ